MLLGAQAWLWAFLALGLAGAVFLLRIEAGRRATGVAVARVSAQRRVVGARSRGQIELFRLRRELAELQSERSRAYQELGRATHERNDEGASRASAQVDDVATLIAAKEAEIGALLGQMEQRVRRAQAEITPTSRLEAPPEPARIPEPFPPPDEGNPPEPAHVPEPSPEDPVPEPRAAARAGNQALEGLRGYEHLIDSAAHGDRPSCYNRCRSSSKTPGGAAQGRLRSRRNRSGG